MLTGAIIIGALMGLVIECGQRGLIPHWGGENSPAWVNLMLLAMAFAGIYDMTDTDRGFMIVSLCWLGALTAARVAMGAAIEIVDAVRNR